MDTVHETWTSRDGSSVTIRPISPADFELERAFVDSLSSATVYQRLMSARRPSNEEIRRFTDIDTRRELALIAVTVDGAGERQVGVARSRGVRRLVATTLTTNSAMLALARRLGFRLALNRNSATVTDLALDL